MIFEEIKSIKSGKKDLRKFGITMGIVLAVLGGLFLWRGRGYYLYFFILSPAFLFFGLVVPILLKPVQKVWMTLAFIMGYIMTRVILTILFFIIITPVSLLARLFRKHFLDLRIDKSNKSYWIYREPKEFDRKDYEKQF